MKFSGHICNFFVKLIDAKSKIRGLIYKFYIVSSGGVVGSNFRCGRGVRIRIRPGARIVIGSGVYLGDYVYMEARPGSLITLNDHCKCTGFTWIVSEVKIDIGSFCLIAEYCSIRDHQHNVALGEVVASQGLSASPVTIGSDVWIGRGVVVLPGADLADGSVVGANAVVKNKLLKNSINVGAPAKQIKFRK